MPTITKKVLYVSVKGTPLEHHAESPVIMITLNELGYNPVFGNPDPIYLEAVNGGPVPKEVVDSAISASMFGWHTPAAHPAVLWFAKQES